MKTRSDITNLDVREIQCPSCMHTVTPAGGEACPACKEDVSLLLALRKVIDSLCPVQSDRADNVSDAMGGPTRRPVEATGGE